MPHFAGADPASSVISVARQRRMCRDFVAEPIEESLVLDAIDVGHRAPTAGNTDARRFLFLSGSDEVEQYWGVTLSQHRRENFPWPGLLIAPSLVVVWTRPDAYVQRYAEPDKDSTGLGTGESSWPVPYWWVDGGMAAEGVLLAAADMGLGACFFGLFEHEAAVAERFGVPDGWRSIGTIALGIPAEGGASRSASADRGRPSLGEAVFRGRWSP